MSFSAYMQHRLQPQFGTPCSSHVPNFVVLPREFLHVLDQLPELRFLFFGHLASSTVDVGM
jgi:hypothetical protein